MSLRLKISLLVTFVASLLAIGLVYLQVATTRLSVHEEIETAQRVANQVMSRISEVQADGGTGAMLDFLQQLGRLRAIDIELVDQSQGILYRSPKSKYKVGQFAPEWFARLIAPPPKSTTVPLIDGKLILRSEPSRAALDGWQQTKQLFWLLSVGFTLLGLIAYWFIGRAMRPIMNIISGLKRIEDGQYDTRLPQYGLEEADTIGRSFNQMAQAINDNLDARAQAIHSAAELASNQRLTHELQKRSEEVNSALSHELHDELGQHVTAIKSMAISINRRIADRDQSIAQASELITESADKIHLAVRSMLQRLTPVSLEQFGLGDAIQDMVSDLRLQNPDIQFIVTVDESMAPLNTGIASAGFRIIQESLTNAIRHSGARRIETTLVAQTNCLIISVADDGSGLANESKHNDGFGLRGMRERATAVGGSLRIEQGKLGGVNVIAQLPYTEVDSSS